MNNYIQLIVSILTGLSVAIPFAYKLVEYISKSIREKNWVNLLDLVMEYMSLAETKFDNGVDREEWVVAMIQASSRKINYEFNEKDVRQLIKNLCCLSKHVNTNVKIEENDTTESEKVLLG